MRTLTAITGGLLFTLVGVVQACYSVLALAVLILVEVLGFALTVGMVAIAVMPEDPVEIPFNRALAIAIFNSGLVLAFVSLLAASRCFYRKTLSAWDALGFVCLCVAIAGMHYARSLPSVAIAYLGAAIFCAVLFSIDRAALRSGAVPDEANARGDAEPVD